MSEKEDLENVDPSASREVLDKNMDSENVNPSLNPKQAAPSESEDESSESQDEDDWAEKGIHHLRQWEKVDPTASGEVSNKKMELDSLNPSAFPLADTLNPSIFASVSRTAKRKSGLCAAEPGFPDRMYIVGLTSLHYDNCQVLYNMVAKLQRQYSEKEKVMDARILEWTERKDNFFGDRRANSCDQTPTFSTCTGTKLPYPVWGLNHEALYEKEPTKRGKIDILMRELTKLWRLFLLLENDCMRLWKRTHDGRSNRHYCCRFLWDSKHPTCFKIDPHREYYPHAEVSCHIDNHNQPWYCGQEGKVFHPLGKFQWYPRSGESQVNDATRFYISSLWKMGKRKLEDARQEAEECNFCLVKRWIVVTEAKLDYLDDFENKLRKSPHVARGSQNADEAYWTSVETRDMPAPYPNRCVGGYKNGARKCVGIN